VSVTRILDMTAENIAAFAAGAAKNAVRQAWVGGNPRGNHLVHNFSFPPRFTAFFLLTSMP
jgi:hypothetical protein